MGFREDPWARELSTTLVAPQDFFRQIGHSSPPSPYQLGRDEQFEVSTHHRVAIWYGGFDLAAAATNRIIPWLEGSPDAALV
jgi:hypothetical protein